MKLTADLMKDFVVARSFKDGDNASNSSSSRSEGDVSCLHFSFDGLTLIASSSSQDQILIYDVENGKERKVISSQKYGVDLINFTHASKAAIHSSTKRDDAIRYISLYDNKFLRYFMGHTQKVTSLSMSPQDETFISASADQTIRLWDLRTPNCNGLMNVAGKPLTAFDPEGLVFAAGLQGQGGESSKGQQSQLKLYDLRLYDKGPFVTFKFHGGGGGGGGGNEESSRWSGLRFSPNGKYILINTQENEMKLVDAFNGNPVQTFTGHLNNKNLPIQGCFSPDSQFVLGGSSDGRLHIWHAESGEKCVVLDGGHQGPLGCVEFNPSYMMMATASTYLNMWLPGNINYHLQRGSSSS